MKEVRYHFIVIEFLHSIIVSYYYAIFFYNLKKEEFILALFKLFKGTSDEFQNSNKVSKANEGWAYFTTDDGKFYIDISGDGTTDAISGYGETGRNRIPINAEKADKDEAGHDLTSYYMHSGAINSHIMSLQSSEGDILYIIPAFIGCTNAHDGETGLVPYPGAGDQHKFLRGDGTWQALPMYNGELADAGTSDQIANFLTS
jgi:hypothetical protein